MSKGGSRCPAHRLCSKLNNPEWLDFSTSLSNLWSGDCFLLARSSMFISKASFGLSPFILNCASVSRQSIKIGARIGGRNLRTDGEGSRPCGELKSAINSFVPTLRSTLQKFSPVFCTRALKTDYSRSGAPVLLRARQRQIRPDLRGNYISCAPQ